jgi:hypothetical protein
MHLRSQEHEVRVGSMCMPIITIAHWRGDWYSTATERAKNENKAKRALARKKPSAAGSPDILSTEKLHIVQMNKIGRRTAFSIRWVPCQCLTCPVSFFGKENTNCDPSHAISKNQTTAYYALYMWCRYQCIISDRFPVQRKRFRVHGGTFVPCLLGVAPDIIPKLGGHVGSRANSAQSRNTGVFSASLRVTCGKYRASYAGL